MASQTLLALVLLYCYTAACCASILSHCSVCSRFSSRATI